MIYAEEGECFVRCGEIFTVINDDDRDDYTRMTLRDYWEMEK